MLLGGLHSKICIIICSILTNSFIAAKTASLYNQSVPSRVMTSNPFHNLYKRVGFVAQFLFRVIILKLHPENKHGYCWCKHAWRRHWFTGNSIIVPLRQVMCLLLLGIAEYRYWYGRPRQNCIHRPGFFEFGGSARFHKIACKSQIIKLCQFVCGSSNGTRNCYYYNKGEYYLSINLIFWTGFKKKPYSFNLLGFLLLYVRVFLNYLNYFATFFNVIFHTTNLKWAFTAKLIISQLLNFIPSIFYIITMIR